MTMTEPVERTLTASDPRLEPWRQFLMAHARVSRRLDDELRADHDLSLAEYDALLTIAQAPGRRIRMRQLADRVILSKSGVTRLIDRLVVDGLVERSACETDARGAEAVLTSGRPGAAAGRLADPPARHRAPLPRRRGPRRPAGPDALPDLAGRCCGPGRRARPLRLDRTRHRLARGARYPSLTGRRPRPSAGAGSGPAASPTRTGRRASTRLTWPPQTACGTTRRGSRPWSSTTPSIDDRARPRSRPGWRPRRPTSASRSRPSGGPCPVPSPTRPGQNLASRS